MKTLQALDGVRPMPTMDILQPLRLPYRLSVGYLRLFEHRSLTISTA